MKKASIADSRVAQRKRAGPITQRSMDRNHPLLVFFFCPLGALYLSHLLVFLCKFKIARAGLKTAQIPLCAIIP